MLPRDAELVDSGLDAAVELVLGPRRRELVRRDDEGCRPDAIVSGDGRSGESGCRKKRDEWRITLFAFDRQDDGRTRRRQNADKVPIFADQEMTSDRELVRAQ